MVNQLNQNKYQMNCVIEYAQVMQVMLHRSDSAQRLILTVNALRFKFQWLDLFCVRLYANTNRQNHQIA